MTMTYRSTKFMSSWVYRCLTLFVLSITTALFSGSHLFFILVVAVSSLLALFELSRIITNSAAVRFSEVLSISILLGYVVGISVHLVYLQATKTADFQMWQRYGIHYSQDFLGLALAAVLFSSALLMVVSAWEVPKRTLALIDELSTPKAERLVWVGVALVLAALYSGQIGYMGVMTADSGRITALGALAVLVVPPLVPYTLALAICERPRVNRLLLWGVLALLISVTVLMGRRYLLYALILSAMVLLKRQYPLSWRRVGLAVFLGLVAVMTVYWGFKFFMALRMVRPQLDMDASILMHVNMALDVLWNEQAKEVGERLADNVGTRTFILSYFAGLMSTQSSHVPAFGKELMYFIQMAIPSILMPEKTAILPSKREEIMHPLYGIPVFDGPGSIMVSGYDDFGLLGVAFYPVALVTLYSGFYATVCRITRVQSIRLFVFFTLLFQLLYIEQSLTASFVALRNLIIMVPLFWIMTRLPLPILAARSLRRTHR